MISSTLKLAFGVLVAALLVSTLFAGQNGGLAGSFLRGAVSRRSAPPRPQIRLARSSPTSAAPDDGFGERVVLRPDAYGHFHAQIDVEGASLRMMVDTGASLVVLSHADAASLGFRPFPTDYRLMARTANGTVAMAPIVLPEVRLGSLVETNVPAAVEKPGAFTGEGLLGMSFLNRLRGYQVKDGLLILKN